MSSIARIIEFIKFRRMTKSEFYRLTGLANGYLDKVKMIGSDKIESIYSCFPEINLEWLITGKGEMIKKQEESLHSAEGEIRALEKEIMELQREVIKLQKENAKLKEYKSIQPLHDRSPADELKKATTSRHEMSTKK